MEWGFRGDRVEIKGDDGLVEGQLPFSPPHRLGEKEEECTDGFLIISESRSGRAFKA